MNLRYPERLLQPWRDLRQFTQELYAMYKDASQDDVSGGIDVEAPPVKIGEQSFKVQRKPGGELNLVPEAAAPQAPEEPAGGRQRFTRPSRRSREPEGRTRPEPIVEERRAAASERPRLPEPSRPRREAPSFAEQEARPLPQFDRPTPFRDRTPPAEQEGTQRPTPELPPRKKRAEFPEETPRKPFDAPTLAFDYDTSTRHPKKHKVVNVGTEPDYPPPPYPAAASGGTTVFIGKVTGRSGAKSLVTLYPDGPAGDPGDDVEVQIQDLDASDSVPNGWLFGIFQFTDSDGNTYYTAKPPMWVA